jgi:outer membrane biosynthesis protein TonB
MKMKNLAMLVAMLALVLGIGSSALAQVMGEHHAQQPSTQQQQAQQPAAQQAQQPSTQQQQAQQPAAQQQQAQQPSTQQQQAQQPPVQQPEAPPAQQPQAQEPPAQQPQAPEPPVELSCADIYRAEQAELAAGSGYPTSVSDEARACDDSGEANPYPAPYFYDDEGFLYVYDPVADRYTALDPATGLLRFYDIVTDSYSTYDPATGEYLTDEYL